MTLWMPQTGSLRVDITDELASTGLDKTQVARVQSLYEECVSKLNSHQQRTNVFNRMSIFFGLPITIFAAVSGTAAFATLGEQVGGSWPVAVIILSLTITVLSTIQTFFRFSEQAAKEQAAANQYAGLLWEIRRWANTTQSRDRTSVDSFVSDVISDMRDTEAEYRGGGQQRREPERSSVAPDTTPPTIISVNPMPNAMGISPMLMLPPPSLNTWTPPPLTAPPSSLLREIAELQFLVTSSTTHPLREPPIARQILYQTTPPTRLPLPAL
jgi:hypothetical protein